MSIAVLRHRPIFGGPFGMGRYALATLPGVSRGLHCLKYLVIDPGPGTVLSVAEDKVAALASAREVLRVTRELESVEAEASPPTQQLPLWPADVLESSPAGPRAPVSRRRRQIFDKCGGRCHYCQAQLELAGQWHIEHALPRALGGLDEISNLFAACVGCNLAKRDRTALEFVAEREAMSAKDRK